MLAAGARLGPFEIVAPLGAGGMGEVYRARDTRLSREVAIKVLPQHLSTNPEVRARFEREARTISSLNHPHICTLFDVGREGDVDYLVMELVEGETLAQKLLKGPLPLDQVLKFGAQIADALDRAHRAGVVHRDLKPGNVMITKGAAKLMDFGLARVTGLAGPGKGSGVTVAALTQTPTVAHGLTTEGAIVGTFQYMSPEQLEGHEADARADLWALGCVLHEMATGKPAFSGKSQASLIGMIMGSEPQPLSQLAPMTPPTLERLVRGCLAKDADQRVQTAHEVKLQLQWIAEGGSQSSSPAPGVLRARHGSPLPWAVAGVAFAGALAFAGLWWQRASAPSPLLRFEMRVPASLSPLGPLRVSPDGRMAAFGASDSSGAPRLWLRSFDDLSCRPLPGTEGAGRPFWSPDSRMLGFFSGGKLRKIVVTGGRPQTICDAPGGSDGTWTSKGLILYDGDGAHPTIQMVSAQGGVPRAITMLDTTKHELTHGWPEALPDGKHFLYAVTNNEADKSELRLGEIGSSKVVRVMPGDGRVEYVPAGYLLFERDGALMAQKFSPGSGKVMGEPRTVADLIGVNRANQMPFFSASKTDVLVFSQGRSTASRMVWVDRTGKAGDDVGPPGSYGALALSPDGRKLAYEQADATGQATDLWVRDLERSVSSRFTIDPGNDIWPVWSADSRTLYWASNRTGIYAVYRRTLDGVDSDSLFYRAAANVGPVDMSRDGRYLACQLSAGGTWDAIAVPLDGSKPVAFAASKFSETRPHFSPDGKWIAYDSDQSGTMQVYVQAFPGPGAPVQISNQGGGNPTWNANGTELFYRTPAQDFFSVPVKTGERFEAGAPLKMFNFPIVLTTGSVGRYAPSTDAQRFLLCAPLQAETNWMPVAVFGWLRGLDVK